MSSSSKPRVFVRDATGIVRNVSGWEAAFANITQVSLGLMAITTFVWAPYMYPGDDIVATIWITGAVLIFNNVMYILFAAQMPRSGGDYVYTSRTLHPALGFVENFTYVIWQLLASGFILTWLSTWIGAEMMHALGTIYNSQMLLGLSSWMSSPWGGLVIGTIALMMVGGLLIMGRAALRVNTILFFFGCIGLAVFIGLLFSINNVEFVKAFNAYVAPTVGSADYYHDVIKTAQSLGRTVPSQPNLGDTLLAMPILYYAFIGYTGSTYYAGEIKVAGKNIRFSTLFALFFAAVFWSLIGIGVETVIGREFMSSIGYLAYNYPQMYKLPFPDLVLFTTALTNNPVLITLVSFNFLAWTFAAPLIILLTITRCLFAWSFDRIIPSRFADIDDRFHTPVKSILLIVFLTWICIVFFNFTTVFSPFNTVLGFVISWTIPAFAGLLYPFIRKDLYESAPWKPKVAGVPLISICGFATIVVNFFMIYAMLVNPALTGAIGPAQVAVIATAFAVGFIIFYISRYINKRNGIPFDLVFAQVPPE